MNKQAIKLNRAALAKFNAAFDAGTVKSVCANVYPHIGSERAVFYKNTDSDGGWLIHTEAYGNNSTRDIAVKVGDAWVKKADEVAYDPYNDAAYAEAMLALSYAARGIEVESN